MKLFAIIITFATALAGEPSNVNNQRLNLAIRLENWRMVSATMVQINELPLNQRPAAISGLRHIVQQLQRQYEVGELYV